MSCFLVYFNLICKVLSLLDHEIRNCFISSSSIKRNYLLFMCNSYILNLDNFSWCWCPDLFSLPIIWKELKNKYVWRWKNLSFLYYTSPQSKPTNSLVLKEHKSWRSKSMSEFLISNFENFMVGHWTLLHSLNL